MPLIFQAVVAGLLGATIPSILTYKLTKRKATAEAADIITTAATKLVEQYQRRISELERHLEMANLRIATLTLQLTSLTTQVETNQRLFQLEKHEMQPQPQGATTTINNITPPRSKGGE